MTQHDPLRTPVLQAYNEIRDPSPDTYDAVAGYYATDAYPSMLQATDFPILAGEGEAKILGNNQAFFFVSNPKGNTDPEKMVLDTRHLKTLLKNVMENDTRFSLQMDEDVLKNPQRFIDKYQHLRPEPDQATREALLGRETALINGFLYAGGVKALIKEIIAENAEERGMDASGAVADVLANGVLRDHFSVDVVRSEKALDAAIWQVDGPQGKLLAKQAYAPNIAAGERKWEMGTEGELRTLSGSAQPEVAAGARAVLDAVEHVNALPATSLNIFNAARNQDHARGR